MRNIIWSKLFRNTPNEATTIAQLWLETPLFTDIPGKHIKFLTDKMHVRHFQTDEIIFQQGDQGAGAIMVLGGSVRIMTNNTQLDLLETGDFFGEIALAATERRAVDAFAVKPTKLVYFLKQDLEEWIEYEPRLGARFLMNLSSELAKRLYHANKLIVAK